MIKIIYVKPGEGAGTSTGCFEKIDKIFIKDTGYEPTRDPEDMNRKVDVWLRQFGGRLAWSRDSHETDYIEFVNEEDATVFALKFGL